MEEEDFLIIFRVWTRDVDHLLHTPTHHFLRTFKISLFIQQLLCLLSRTWKVKKSSKLLLLDSATMLVKKEYPTMNLSLSKVRFSIAVLYWAIIVLFRTKSTIISINHCPRCKLFHVWRNWKINSRCSLCCQACIRIQVTCLWRWLSRSCTIHFLGKLCRQVNWNYLWILLIEIYSAWAAANNWPLQNSHNVSKSFQKH